MNKKNKKSLAKLGVILISATLLSACGNNQGANKATKNINHPFVTKKTTYQKDKTTKVLVDSDSFKKSDIVKIIKHGDHWHVFTADGKEHITYTDPNKMSDSTSLELVNVVTLAQLKNKKVVAIKIHGNHWHVFTADGNEYLTYQNPSSMFPHIRVTKYTGHHGSRGTASITKALAKDRVVKILQHGDHFHIYTASGKEFISYSDPRGMYPHAVFGQYVGTHGQHANQKVTSKQQLHLVSVLGKKVADKNRIVKILQHGDHYHIYDAEGNESITYSDPRALYPNAVFGQYVGTHADHQQAQNIEQLKFVNVLGQKTVDKNRIVKILQHGDHYHVYDAEGNESITYSDPRALYPDAVFGQYVGTHADHHSENNEHSTHIENNEHSTHIENKHDDNKDAIANLKIVPVLGQKGKIDRYDIIKILQHEDHYHIYDSQGNEGITYTNPRALYPNAKFGQYVGTHSQHNTNVEIDWPEGIDKIVDHGDHWHLYKNGQEITVVHENPKSHYPNAEYIDERPKDYSNITVENNEIFTYDEVKPEVKDGLREFLKKKDMRGIVDMEGFGDLTNETRPVYGSETDENGQPIKKDIFYFCHNGDHYHALTIKQIIQAAKAGEYGSFTARDIVAAMKWSIENKEKLVTFTVSKNIDAVKNYLKQYYHIDDENDISSVGNQIGIYGIKADGNPVYFNVDDDFTVENGQIKSIKPLPAREEKTDQKSEADHQKELPVENVNPTALTKVTLDSVKAFLIEKYPNSEVSAISGVLYVSKGEDEAPIKFKLTDFAIKDNKIVEKK
ncbi:MAG: hypothetical protein N4S94_00705 [Lactobacillus iners]|nr:hypothetical protein [Lactobacillus iners]MCT7682273.1 hypothetical protein [Lactobacillus iners]MCT7778839.1 hypothetical protein [Lactobacillus iners]MCT7847722.1 hypothetical protein [Lactobacillus iners]